MTDLELWWKYLTFVQKGYWSIAVPSTLLFFILMGMMFLGADDDAVSEEIGEDNGKVLSIKAIVGFLTFFSWTGITLLEGGMATWLTVILSAFAGVCFVMVLVWLLRQMSRLTDDGTTQVSEALLQAADVYLRVPQGRSGYGKVHLKLNGGLRELDAMTDEDVDIESGVRVVVTEVMDDGTVLVGSV